MLTQLASEQSLKCVFSWVWWFMLAIPTHRPENLHELVVSLVYFQALQDYIACLKQNILKCYFPCLKFLLAFGKPRV